MSPAASLISQNVPGYGLSDGGCLPCSGVSGRAFNVSPCSRNKYIRFQQIKVLPLRCASGAGSRTSSICNADSSGQRRNPDFSRQNRNGFSRNKNRHNEGRDNTDGLEDSEMFSSKNGPSLISASPQFQATSAPGPKEREIVELFRKVQAQLREKAARKEERTVEDSRGHNKQNGTVDSLLRLLRKHSVQRGKRNHNSSSSSSRDFVLDHPEQNSSFIEDETPNFFDSNNKVKHEVKDSEVPSVSRPVSNFQRRSPVPQFKYQPINSGSITKTGGKKKEIMPEPETTPEPEVESEAFLTNGAVFDEISYNETSEIEDSGDEIDGSEEENASESRDLSGMKLPELRAVAKSQGLKGFSRLKKRELLDLLTGNGSI